MLSNRLLIDLTELKNKLERLRKYSDRDTYVITKGTYTKDNGTVVPTGNKVYRAFDDEYVGNSEKLFIQFVEQSQEKYIDLYLKIKAYEEI